ncbi:pirin family protein [Cellvibrio japonicus]|uniref:Cupin-fold protein n=1 Tax=Cellvibrio japonicus (strain Ueda107) TaxID=498211 RepID=B3PGN8_CELJU|nr:pirin family protein [Cellvibrio japonicus]ACE83570.1 cupin-fold protein [Cellvibrio japonicus Ueda107]QEI12384.1 pirin family protein [Cellvibrio japonicus]QEI15957.1 pirin family protein [Cellvibrio japonicus]QEI19536.1 pirin family protein [Cellvibrio japonicus]
MRLIIEPRVQQIGFEVRRLLPSRHQQRVGPFIFFDHMGPARFKPDTTEGDVRQHPHIGLATVTYLFSGAMVHRDSLGVEQVIEPGAINLMTAGSGIVHSERIPDSVRRSGAPVEGIQTWLALPTVQEDCEPEFAHYDASDIPRVEGDGYCAHILIGTALGKTSPVTSASPTTYVDLQLDAGSSLSLDIPGHELAVYVCEGELAIAKGDSQDPVCTYQLALLEPGDRLIAISDVRLMVAGGEPITDERFIFWNFVASSKEKLHAASARWDAGEFTLVPGETDRIPLPR